MDYTVHIFAKGMCMELFNIEIILAIATVVISIVVFVSEKMQTEGQVRPHLNIFSGSHRNQIYVRIANCGMGSNDK